MPDETSDRVLEMDPIATFYDALADDYHLVYQDWELSIGRQAAALDRIIREELSGSKHRVLDCTCGIGTQSLGLARLGYEVVGTDISQRSIDRARSENERLGLSVRFGVQDLRSLSFEPSEVFDVVLSADNSIPHLVEEEDLQIAVDRMTQ